MRMLGVGQRLAGRPRTTVTVGVYDGVHNGHVWLLRRLRKAAGYDTPVVVVTFDPHPLSVIRPVAAPRTLTPTARKLEILAQTGLVDACLVLPFDEKRREQTAAAFVEDVLVNQLGAANVIVGSNFRFGHNRDGDIDLLQEMGSRLGFAAQGAPLLPISGLHSAVPCSSTYIRGLIRQGDVAKAARLLGRDHRVSGTIAGVSRPRDGRGIPTVVVRVDENAALPVEGSFLGTLMFPDGRRYVAGISVRQGFVTGPSALLDVHLGASFDFGVGGLVDVEFARHIWATCREDMTVAVTDSTEVAGRAAVAGGWAVDD